MVKFVIAENESNQRLDRFLRKYMARAPLGMIYKIIRKDVKLNGKRASADTVIREGDELTSVSYTHLDVYKRQTLRSREHPQHFQEESHSV